MALSLDQFRTINMATAIGTLITINTIMATAISILRKSKASILNQV